MPTTSVAFARLFAGILMHVAMLKEFKNSLSRMKYALNHKWLFRGYRLAFFAQFLQAIMVVFVTLLNYYVIIMGSPEVIDISKDFLAMMIISDFDDFFFSEYKHVHIAKRIVMQQDDTFEGMLAI